MEPKEPGKDGYVFEGWYYTDEDGKEIKWDFDMPVHQSVTLKAKWKKEPAGTKTTETTTVKKPKKKRETGSWNYREIGRDTKENRTAETGDEHKMPWIFGCVAGLTGAALCLFMKKRIQ